VIEGWLEAEQSVKAFYYASTDLKAQSDKEAADKIKQGGKGKRRGRK
jgi:hypothetical protein